MIARVFADETGETHIAIVKLPASASGGPGLSSRELGEIPTTTLAITKMLEKRRTLDLHPAPRRQLVLVVHGEFEITASDGERKRFGPGDCLFADDVNSQGHHFEDVGQERLMMFQIGIDGNWQWPS